MIDTAAEAKALATLQAQAALRGLALHPIYEADGCIAGYYMERRGAGRAYSELDDVREVLRQLERAAQSEYLPPSPVGGPMGVGQPAAAGPARDTTP